KPYRPSEPERGYVSKGARSRFGFGAGLQIGVNSVEAKQPLIYGLSVHVRAKGIIGANLEYDFNRVAETPDPDDLSIESIHFIPNMRFAVVIYPYRWKMLAPFLLLGLGLDTESDVGRTNYQLGIGLETTWWKDRIAVVTDFRVFFPQPSDMEKHRERVQITGADMDTSTGQYYNFKNILFTISLRFYY
ncbi:hypothetical protein ACFL51_01790, partial [Myxococcota bacterium]